MEILQYVKSLVPTFGKDRVVEDIKLTMNRINNTVMPMYRNADQVISNGKAKGFKSDINAKFLKIYDRIVGRGSRNSFYLDVAERLVKVIDNLTTVEKMLLHDPQNTFVSIGISLQHANLVKIAELSSFISIYAGSLLNTMLIYEIAEIESNANYIKENLTAGMRDYIDDYFTDFCTSLSAFSNDEKEFEERLKNIPEVSVTPDKFAPISATLSIDVMDPFNLSSIANSAVYNPIYHLRMMINAFQADLYRRDMEVKKALELRLLQMQMMQEGEYDAKLEQEIEYTQNRINAIEQDLRQAREG